MAYCENCGNVLYEDDVLCSKCKQREEDQNHNADNPMNEEERQKWQEQNKRIKKLREQYEDD